MARNYRKDAGVDIPITPTPTLGPDPIKTRTRTSTPKRTPWPPMIWGTPTPMYLSPGGYPMGIREMGGGGIASKRMSKSTKSNSGNFSQKQIREYFQNKLNNSVKSTKKPIRKADNPKPSDPRPSRDIYLTENDMPSRYDSYIPFVSGRSKLTPEQRGRMMANTATSDWAKDKINDTLTPIIMGALMASPIAPFLAIANSANAAINSKTGKKVINVASDAYDNAKEKTQHEIRGIKMLPKAARAVNQSILDELHGRSIGDYAIDRADQGVRSIYNSAVNSGSKALASGWKQQKENLKNSPGTGELIGAATALGLNDKKRKELLDTASNIAGKAWQYNPTNMVIHAAVNQIPDDVKSRGITGNVKNVKNTISDFITNNGRKALASASAYGNKALADVGSSISSFFDKSATSTRGSRKVSKSLKSNKKANKYF